MNVTSLVQPRIAGRARALLGSSRVLTLSAGGAADESWAQIAVEPAGDERFYGLIRDDSPFLDRVRRGMDAGFTVFDGELSILRGRCKVTPQGRVEDAEGPAAVRLRDRAAFLPAGCVLIEIEVATLEVDDGDTPAAGAVPRT